MDPGKFAAKIQAYQSSQDPVLKDLVARIEAGDVEATLEFQQEIVKRELGDSKYGWEGGREGGREGGDGS